MTKSRSNLWGGLTSEARKGLGSRDYQTRSWGDRISTEGVEAGLLSAAGRAHSEIGASWIPGVEIFTRTIHPQRHRGFFGELVRREEGVPATIGLWPNQWATARMFAHTAKGFHIHPPSVPKGVEPAEWFRRLFLEEPIDYSLRRYESEQWDAMFFVQGMVEMILREARVGLPQRTMRFFIDGDNHRSANNIAVVIPPGVAHAIRVEGSEDAIMVYGTSTPFNPEFEGRIASDVETAILPESWQRFLADASDKSPASPSFRE